MHNEVLQVRFLQVNFRRLLHMFMSWHQHNRFKISLLISIELMIGVLQNQEGQGFSAHLLQS
eukprot:m.252153 g.252153  ORF g.252153 m.252153 type:complete len:62 (-) comp15468_c0_seq5:935-1120(-)